MTRAEFVARYPEFSERSDEILDGALADAAAALSSETFGSSYDRAQGLRAAHLLWTSQFGTTTRLDGDKDPETKSRYWQEYKRLEREVVPRAIVL